MRGFEHPEEMQEGRFAKFIVPKSDNKAPDFYLIGKMGVLQGFLRQEGRESKLNLAPIPTVGLSGGLSLQFQQQSFV
jgi:hypothetical protein